MGVKLSEYLLLVRKTKEYIPLRRRRGNGFIPRREQPLHSSYENPTSHFPFGDTDMLKLSLCLTKHYTMNTYGEMDV
jgi:hypothetical protein